MLLVTAVMAVPSETARGLELGRGTRCLQRVRHDPHPLTLWRGLASLNPGREEWAHQSWGAEPRGLGLRETGLRSLKWFSAPEQMSSKSECRGSSFFMTEQGVVRGNMNVDALPPGSPHGCLVFLSWLVVLVTHRQRRVAS